MDKASQLKLMHFGAEFLGVSEETIPTEFRISNRFSWRINHITSVYERITNQQPSYGVNITASK